MHTIPIGSCRYISRCLALLFILLYPLSAVANDKVRLQLNWQHHFQFAGYYAAIEKGYYQAAGLDVELIPGKHWGDPVQKVLEGKADLGISDSSLLLRREKGAPVVVLAVIFQHSTAMLTPYVPAAVAEGPYPSDAVKQGHLSRPLGSDFYGDNLFSTERQIQLRPKVVKAFLEASLKGWEYAMQHQEEMVQLIYSKYSEGQSIEQLRHEAAQLVPLVHSSLVQIGYLNPTRWHHIANVYVRLGMMKPGFDINSFLYNPHPRPVDVTWIYWVLCSAFAFVMTATLIAARFSSLSADLSKEIDDNKQFAAALQESESLHRSILIASPDDITITDAEGNIKMVSPAGVRMFRFEREEDFLGHNIAEFILPEDRGRVRADIEQMLQGSFSGVGEYRGIRPDTSFFDIEINCQYISNSEDPPTNVVFVIRDITERKRAGHSCLLAMGEMIGAIAHQWRQPLATLGMIIQRTHAVGTLKTLTPEGLDEFKANSMRQIRYMSDTIEEFRGFYRTEKNREPFSPLSCVNDAAKLFEPQFASHGIAVDVQCHECDELLVDGYPNEFKQVILNLLGNARDAILESRKIQRVLKDGRITVRISVRNDITMIIEVNDNGCGIADDIAPRILDPYFTTKEDSGGTGLGLYMSRRIVEDSLGGRLSLVQGHEGATFRIELLLGKMS